MSLLLPTHSHDMNDAWKLDHIPRKVPLTFLNSVVGSFTSPSSWLMKEGLRGQGQRLNFTAQWRDHLIWQISNHSHHDFTSCFFFKTLVVGLAGAWTHDLLLGTPVLSHLSLPGGNIVAFFFKMVLNKGSYSQEHPNGSDYRTIQKSYFHKKDLFAKKINEKWNNN